MCERGEGAEAYRHRPCSPASWSAEMWAGGAGGQ